MEIDTQMIGKTLYVNITGEIDHHNAGRIKQIIETEYSQNSGVDIVFDFSQVSFMDSSGIGMIMGRYKNLVPKGKIKVVGVQAGIRRIFDISGLHNIITIGE